MNHDLVKEQKKHYNISAMDFNQYKIYESIICKDVYQYTAPLVSKVSFPSQNFPSMPSSFWIGWTDAMTDEFKNCIKKDPMYAECFIKHKYGAKFILSPYLSTKINFHYVFYYYSILLTFDISLFKTVKSGLNKTSVSTKFDIPCITSKISPPAIHESIPPNPAVKRYTKLHKTPNSKPNVPLTIAQNNGSLLLRNIYTNNANIPQT